MNDCVEITKKGELVARVALNPKDLETEDLGQVIAKLKVVEDWIEEARKELRVRLDFGDTCSMFHIDEVNGKRKIHDVALAWQRLRDAGVPVARLFGCVDMPIGRAEKVFARSYMDQNPGTGEAEALAAFGHVVGDALSRGETTKRMERSL